MKREITFKGVEMVIEFDYQPAEKRTRDYPGIGESVSAELIFIGEQDCTELLEAEWEAIEDHILDEIHEESNPANYI